jgi:dihydropteroate synthase
MSEDTVLFTPIRIMAIINTSPDSFSGDGLDVHNEKLLKDHLEDAIQNGADILDIGGQSTRPGATIITDQEEIDRVVPAITLARKLSATIPISIDTFKPDVAKAALAAGATILNDITGFSNTAMIQLANAARCEIVVMHMRGTPLTMSTLTSYPDGVVEEIHTFFRKRTAELIAAGIAPENIILDPGIGFAKTAAQNYEITRRLSVFCEDGFQVLYGASNKSFIGKTLSSDGVVAPVEDRAIGTVVVQTCALLNGASIIRVHDIKAAVQTRDIVNALLNSEDRI